MRAGLYLFVAIDRTSKFAFVQLHDKAGRNNAAEFLRNLIKAIPYKIHTILTDNDLQFTHLPHQKYAATHLFDRICIEHDIDHRLTKGKHPWTNGQTPRMNLTIKEATVKTYHYDSHDQLDNHLKIFINAYNYGRRLKTLKGQAPYEYIQKCRTIQPELFHKKLDHNILGLNS